MPHLERLGAKPCRRRHLTRSLETHRRLPCQHAVRLNAQHCSLGGLRMGLFLLLESGLLISHASGISSSHDSPARSGLEDMSLYS